MVRKRAQATTKPKTKVRTKSATKAADTPTPRPARDGQLILDGFFHHLRFTQAEAWNTAQPYDHFASLAMAVRDQIVDRMIATQKTYHEQDVKRVYYLSLEYLLGRLLRNNLVCLGHWEDCQKRFAKLGLDLEHV